MGALRNNSTASIFNMENFGLISAPQDPQPSVIWACPPPSGFPDWNGNYIFFSFSNIGRIFAAKNPPHSPTPLDRLRRKQMDTEADK